MTNTILNKIETVRYNFLRSQGYFKALGADEKDLKLAKVLINSMFKTHTLPVGYPKLDLINQR